MAPSWYCMKGTWRMRRLLWIMSLAGMAVAASTAQAAPRAPQSIPHSGKWQVNYDANACHLLGSFGDPYQGFAVRLSQYQPGEMFDLTLYGKAFRDAGQTVPVTVDYGLPSGPQARRGLGGTAGKLPLLILGGERLGPYTGTPGPLSPVTPEQEAAVRSITIGFRGRAYRFETGSMAPPMAAMRTCLQNLVAHWGYDAALAARLARPPVPIGSPGDWLVSRDYPKEPLSRRVSGLVKFRLEVDEAGMATACHVLEQTNPPEFGRATCEKLQNRARFEPARDRDGKPARWFWISTVRWQV